VTDILSPAPSPYSPAPVDYLVVGHVCIDLFGKKRVLGGSATYAAITAKRLGQRVGVLTSADFEPGIVDTLVGLEHLRTASADIRVARLPSAATTTFVNVYESDHRRQQIGPIAEILRAEHVLPEWRDAPTVHLAPIAMEVALDLVPAFPSALLGVTPQGWMRGWDEQGMIHAVAWEAADFVLDRADVVIFSEEDVPDPAVIPRYAEQAKLLIITEHRHGAAVYERGKDPWRSPAFRPTRVFDPTGAGDVFAAGFLTRYARTGDARASADYANCVASFVLEKRGWEGIPTADQVEERLERGKRRRAAGRGLGAGSRRRADG
jgi:sugar/nucleoside kinase (ribokinase family)